MANINFTNVTIGGRFVTDPELKTTANGVSVVSFRMAVSRRTGSESVSDFYNIVAWRNTAEFIAKFFRKGSSAVVAGQLQTRSYKANDGTDRFVTEIVASDCYFADSKNEVAPVTPVQAAPVVQPNLVELDEDEELPF